MSTAVIDVAPGLSVTGGTSTNVLTASEHFGDAESLTIFAPATLTEVAKVQVSDTEASPVWRDLQRGGADVTIVVGEAETIENLSFKALKILLDGSGTRAFGVNKKIRMR